MSLSKNNLIKTQQDVESLPSIDQEITIYEEKEGAAPRASSVDEGAGAAPDGFGFAPSNEGA
jgi:hypothetical protein